MIKRFLVILTLTGVFAACSENSKDSLTGVTDPLSEWTLPVAVHAGGEGAIQWNGFSDDPSLMLTSNTGEEYSLDVLVVTASGLSFRVPADVPEGEYMLVLTQETRIEMGKLEVLPAMMPVSAVKVPAGAIQGEEVMIEGLGYEPGCVIVLSGVDVGEFEIATELVSSGVLIRLPEDLPEADYQVYLLQDGMRWLLSSSFKVSSALVVKSLKAVRLYSPYIGETEVMYEWAIHENEMVLSEYIVEGGVAELNVYDRYIADGDGSYVLADDGFEASNNMEFSYLRDADGRVTSSDVLRYGQSAITSFDWSYDSGGFLTEIMGPSKAFRTIEYEGGNLTLYRQIQFEYDGDPLYNHSCAYNVIWGYMSLLDTVEPFVYFPYLLGWYAPSSMQLPSKMHKPSPTGQGMVTSELSYVFDEDGYVISMSWMDGSQPHHVEFEY